MSKSYKNIYPDIINIENVYYALHKTRLGKEKYKLPAIHFVNNETVNLNYLVYELSNQTYEVGEYTKFKVYEPKEREIYAPRFRDKIVQHMIHNVIKEIYFPCFIYDSYACIENKGTHACNDRIGHFLRKSKWEYGESAYIVKLDIKKFFYNIDRDVLKQLLRKKITDRSALKLLDVVIDSSPGEIGLPLGNLTSQIFANIYLNEFDQYMKRNMKLKYYVRYADDVVIIVSSKKEAKGVLEKSEQFLHNKLKLRLNEDKSKIFPIKQGVNAIGFKHYATHRLLRNDSKRKIKSKIRSYQSGNIDKHKMIQMYRSWIGHAKHGDTHNFVCSLEIGENW
jgi:retron-type reverse transcriptase